MGSRIAWRQAALVSGVLIIGAGCAVQGAAPPEAQTAGKARPASPARPQQQIGPALLVGEGHRLYAVWGAMTPGQKAVDAKLSRSDDEGRTWLQSPISLEGDPARGGVPQLFSEPDGALDAFYALKLPTGEQQARFQRSRDGGTTWEEPVVIRSGRTLHRPLFLRRPGYLYAIIPEGAGKSDWKLEVHRSTDGGRRWEQLPTLEHAFTPTGSGIRDFDARLDPQGRLHLVWAEFNQMDLMGVVFYNRLTPGPGGAAWLQRPIQVSEEKSASHGAIHPKIELGPDRGLTAIWEDQIDMPPPFSGALPIKIKASHSRDDGATWSPPVLLSAPGIKPFVSAGAILVSDGGRHVYAAWVEADSDRLVRLKFSRSDDGGATWQEAEGLRYEADPDTRLLASFKLTVDAAGHVYLLWQQTEGDAWTLLFNRSADNGRTWMPTSYRLVKSPQTSKKMHWVDMQATEAGGVWVAFDGGSGPGSEIFLIRSKDHGATWSAREAQISR